MSVPSIPTDCLVLEVNLAHTGTAGLTIVLDEPSNDAVSPVSAGQLVVGSPGPHLPFVARTQPSWRSQIVPQVPPEEGITIMIDTADTVIGTDALCLSIGYGGNNASAPKTVGPLIVGSVPTYAGSMAIMAPGGVPEAVAVNAGG